MTNRMDSNQVDGVKPTPPPGANETLYSRGNNKVFKSGPLYLSSKGIGWTSWKKRWFILTRTSLVFFRSDPNAIPQKGSEVNLTLGGIDLNSSGSVVVKEDKKLLTVLFPDGRDGRGDGRAFTLKAETLEDLYEWKTALEEALSSAPSAALVMGQNGIFRNDQGHAVDASPDQSKDRQPVKSLVLGRPILLALEDIDGTPSFLEKALRFMEEHGVKVEGILRQAADVDDVERRIREYEHGKSEFFPGEDPHVIADCVKYVLRELPSSPVPASCCNALLEACRTDRSMRVSAMRTAICETFPEPNRCLLQRILMMMQAVASHKAENRMSISAVAACMAPLLLRPLLAGDCELEHSFDMGGDGSVQLLQAAAAANHAQAIVITLLEEYNSLFAEGSVSAGIYSESEESGTESEELTEDDEAYEDDEDDYTTEDSDADADADDDIEHASNASETSIEFHGTKENNKGSRCSNSGSISPEVDSAYVPNQESPRSPPRTRELQQDHVKVNNNLPRQSNDISRKEADRSGDLSLADHTENSTSRKSSDVLNGPASTANRGTVWGRAPGKKNLSMETIDFQLEDEAEIEKLEATKNDLEQRITAEAKENACLQGSLEKRKNALHERRIALEKDVARLQEQLERERELRAALESGLKTSHGKTAVSSTISGKVRADLDEIAQAEAAVAGLTQKAEDLAIQLNQKREQNFKFQHDTTFQNQYSPRSKAKTKEKQKNAEAATTQYSHEKPARSKYDTHLEKTNIDKERKQEPLFSAHENSLQNQYIDQVQNQKPAGPSVHSSTPSRRSGGRNEGANTTSSALSKLTNRLNFLKERRTQIANELQNIDKGRNSGQPIQNLEKGRGGSEARQSGQHMDMMHGSEGQSSEYTEGSDNHAQSLHSSDNQSDKGRRTDNQPNLDRGKSESFPQGEKNRSKATPRTYSR